MRRGKKGRLPILILIMSLFYLLPMVSQAAELEDSYLSYLGRGTDGRDEFRLNSDDLLAKFKGVMPGDQVRQRLVVKNESDKVVEIKLSIVSADLVDLAFLQALTLTLTKGDAILYSGRLDLMTGDEGTELGTFEVDQKTEYVLDLNVPLSLDNHYNDYLSNSEWSFAATDSTVTPPIKPEPKPEPTPQPAPGKGQPGSKVIKGASLPQMGAHRQTWQVMGVVLVTLAILIFWKKVVKKIGQSK